MQQVWKMTTFVIGLRFEINSWVIPIRQHNSGKVNENFRSQNIITTPFYGPVERDIEAIFGEKLIYDVSVAKVTKAIDCVLTMASLD